MGGALGSLGSLPSFGEDFGSTAGGYLLNLVAQTTGGTVGSSVQQILTNAADHEPWSEGLAAAMGWGALASFAQNVAPAGLAKTNSGKFGLSLLGLAAYNTVEDVPPMVDQASASALSADAVAAQRNTMVALMRPYATHPRRPITISPLRSPFRTLP